MVVRRIGVITHDDFLAMELLLRGRDLIVTRVDGEHDLAGQDVALIDVPAGKDAVALLDTVPEGPAVVLLCVDEVDLDDVIVVQRPCAVSDVLAALDEAATPNQLGWVPINQPTAENGEGVVVIGKEPGPEPGPEPDARSAPEPEPAPPPAADEPPEEFAEPVPAESAPEPGEDVFDEFDVLTPAAPSADALASAVDEAARLDASPEEFADEVAGLLVAAHDLDHVALWHPGGKGHVILGAAGLSPGARQAMLAERHPVIMLARTHDGMVFRGPYDQGPRAPGVPGSISPSYAMVLLDADPVSILTLSAERLTAGQVQEIATLLRKAIARRPPD